MAEEGSTEYACLIGKLSMLADTTLQIELRSVGKLSSTSKTSASDPKFNAILNLEMIQRIVMRMICS